MVKWPSDPITNPKGKHTLWWVDWYFSVAAQPWLCCEAALLPFRFQCKTKEQTRNGAHHLVCTEELFFGTDKTMTPLGKGLELGRTACHPTKPEMVTFYKGGMVWMHSWLGSICLSHFCGGSKHLPLNLRRTQLGPLLVQNKPQKTTESNTEIVLDLFPLLQSTAGFKSFLHSSLMCGHWQIQVMIVSINPGHRQNNQEPVTKN